MTITQKNRRMALGKEKLTTLTKRHGYRGHNVRLMAFYTKEILADDIEGWGAEKRFRSIAAAIRSHEIEFVILNYTQRSSVVSSGCNYVISRRKKLQLISLILAGVRIAKRLNCEGLYAYHADSVDVLVPSYLVALICRRPLFIVLHDDAARQQDDATVWQLVKLMLSNNRSRLRTRFKRLLSCLLRKIALLDATVCICVSKSTAEYARSIGIKRISIIGNGVDQKFLEDLECPKIYDSIFVGRIEKTKGIETLLRAWRKVVSTISSAKLVLVGSTESKEFSRFVEIVSDLKLEQNVLFTGHVHDLELRKLLSASRTFVFPSEREGFGVVVAEAMAAGLPCIISDVPALVENFGSTAAVVPVGDSVALAEEILALLQNKAEYEAIAASGKRLASTMTWGQVSEKEARVILRTVKELKN